MKQIADYNGIPLVGPSPNKHSIAWVSSADGSVVVGKIKENNIDFAVIWKIKSDSIIVEEIIYKSTLNIDNNFKNSSSFFTVSSDGKIFAGQYGAKNSSTAFISSSDVDTGELEFLSKLNLDRVAESFIYAISDNMKYIVGNEKIDDEYSSFIVWDGEVQARTSEPSFGCALAVDVGVVGAIGRSDELLSASWKPNTGWFKLPKLSSDFTFGHANAISADGKFIVGDSASGAYSDKDWTATIWIDKQMSMDIKEFMIKYSYTNLQVWDIRSATAISSNGRCIGGWGFDPSGAPQPWIYKMS